MVLLQKRKELRFGKITVFQDLYLDGEKENNMKDFFVAIGVIAGLFLSYTFFSKVDVWFGILIFVITIGSLIYYLSKR